MSSAPARSRSASRMQDSTFAVLSRRQPQALAAARRGRSSADSGSGQGEPLGLVGFDERLDEFVDLSIEKRLDPIQRF